MSNNCLDNIIVKLGHCYFDDGWDGDAHIVIQCLFSSKNFTNIPEGAYVIDATRFMREYNLNDIEDREIKLNIIRECFIRASKIKMLNNDFNAIVRYVQEELEFMTLENIKKRILK